MRLPPLVSVCIPTYNHGEVLGVALRSALLQDYVNIEILVVDNHSSDNTQEVVDKVSAGDPRVRYERHSENIGMAENFSACISTARGDYIKLLCADDFLMPDCVTAMVDILEHQQETVLVASARQLVDEFLAPLRIAGYSRRTFSIDGASAIRECFFHGNLIGEPTAVMFRRQQAMRGFRKDYQQLMDLEMWMYLLRFGSMTYIAKPLCKVRQHPQQATQQHLKSGTVLHDKRQLFREFHGNIAGATMIDKLRWDIRMAVTLLRTARSNPGNAAPYVEEVYFRRLFSWLTQPVAWVIWAFVGRGR